MAYGMWSVASGQRFGVFDTSSPIMTNKPKPVVHGLQYGRTLDHLGKAASLAVRRSSRSPDQGDVLTVSVTTDGDE